MTKEELRKFADWLNKQRTYINDAYGGECVLSQASECIRQTNISYDEPHVDGTVLKSRISNPTKELDE